MTVPRQKLEDAWALFRFSLSGLPGFCIALGVNALLVELAHWPKPLAYLVVVWVQMTFGFLMCHYLVFRTRERRSLWRAYWQFALSMGLIRIADWSLYTASVELLKIRYLIAQIACSAIFITVKFVFAKAIFRSNSGQTASNLQSDVD